MSVFEFGTKSHLDRTAFFDDPVDVARYDKVKYPVFDKLTDKAWGFFWRPEEVVLTKDSKDFRSLTEHEQHIFVSNLKRQILLDSVQGRAPTLAFLPICSLPELEIWIQTWAFFETIHSKSYTHILRNVYPDPSSVFDDMMEIKEIVDCANDISKYYDDLIDFNKTRDVYSFPDKRLLDHKKSLWRCLNAVNALEGVRFYVSFACSWAFAELKKMEGNAKIIKFIARDENVHLAATQHLLKILPKEDPDFAQIKEELKDEMTTLFLDVVDQEKAWAEYLFKDGSMIGLNKDILCDYIEWIARKRMMSISLPCPFKITTDPLPWTAKWIAGGEVQVAPQETQISSYVVGAINQDIEEDTFKGFQL
jgi:ribonucleoside-diphosphate reductase beta chain